MIFFCAQHVFAQSLPYPQRTLWGSTSYALGGAGVSTFSGMDAFSINPAGLSGFRDKSAAGGFYSRLPDDISTWSVGVVDGVSPINAGAQFKWTDFGDSSRQQIQLAMAYPFAWGSFGVGIHTEKLKGLSGPGNGWHFTSSSGLIINAGQAISIGASVLSLLDKENDSLYPPLLRLGASFQYPGSFRVAFDAFRRFKMAQQDWNYSTGLEVFWQDWFGISGGYHFNNSDEASFWATGLFLRAPRIDVGATYQQRTKSSSARGFTTEVTLKF